MQLENGDYLEYHYKDFLRQNIPSYETIWGQFIGHDGKGKMIVINQLPDDKQKARTNFAEYLYTCIESFVCMNSICKSIHEVNLENPEEYLTMLNNFISFQAHSGRIHDNTNRLLTIYLPASKAKELINRLEDTYQKRNTVLHGKKLPYRIIDSLVLIAPIKGADESAIGWHSSMNWADFSESNLVFFTDYLNQTLLELCSVFNDIISNLIDPIKKIIFEHKINIETNTDSKEMMSLNSSGVITGFSGSSFPYSIGKSGHKGKS